jgi:hypothetical protein
VRASIPLSRPVVQLVLALCLISAIVIVGLVVSFALRTTIAQDLSAVAHAWSMSFGANALADGPNTLCNASSGGCP